jgi:hypothetical protein
MEERRKKERNKKSIGCGLTYKFPSDGKVYGRANYACVIHLRLGSL